MEERGVTQPSSLLSAEVIQELVDEARRVPAGDFVEVGVYKGGSAVHLAAVAREQARRLFLFDTFEGMPFQLPGVDDHKVGDFGDTSLADVQATIPDAHFRVGVFPETLTDDVGPIALAHVDCDQYRSVKDCCERLAPRMVEGGVMIFDDPGCLDSATRAVREAFPAHRVEVSPQGKWRVRF